MKYSTINQAYKGLVSIPAWQQQLLSDNGGLFADNISSVQDAFANVPLINRAVKMRCDAISSVPVTLKKLKSGAEAEWPFAVELPDLLWKTEAALLGAGKAIILKLQNRVRTLDLQWLNPFTVSVHYVEGQGLTFSQTGRVWGAGEIIYIKEFSYGDDITSGVATVQACLNDAALMNYQTRFASRFFEAGAMPIVLVSAEGIQDDEKQRIQNFFSKLASGVTNAWRVLATRTKLSPEVVSQDLDKMTMPELYTQASKNIAAAFGIPVNMFQGDDNYASADSHRMQFWQDVIRPRGKMIEAAFNRQLLNAMGLEMAFDFDELDIFQEDENQRATSFATYVNAGVNPMAAAEMLGIEMPEDYPFLAEKEPEPAPVIVQPAALPPEEKPNPFDEDMEKFMRKALKRVKDGKEPDCAFESDVIPGGILDELHAALKLCHDADEVKAVFEGKPEFDVMSELAKELKRANDLLEQDERAG